jgi:hypothetical protein
VKKRSIALALCCSLICSPAYAKTFVGVLWPMFGPFFAVGLVELVAEIKLMPNVEVKTYLHQSWPSLVEDLDRQPKGTHTLVVGYSLGANSTVFVANKVNHIDSIIALQPSLLSWNPELTGKVGRIVEIYNPDPAMTLGGMGSRKLVGENIEYIANQDSHLGTQFSSEFRELVKSEIARLATEDSPAVAQTDPAQQSNPANQIPQAEPAAQAAGKQNDVNTGNADKTTADARCDTAEKKPDELSQNMIDPHSFEPRHYGSLMWQAAATQEKKPDEAIQKMIDGTPCSH